MSARLYITCHYPFMPGQQREFLTNTGSFLVCKASFLVFGVTFLVCKTSSQAVYRVWSRRVLGRC